MKTIKRYIPDMVYKKIQTLNYKNVEHLYIICDMITRISIFRKEDDDYGNNYKDIPLTYFTDIITDKTNFYKALNLLGEEGIIECDGEYSKYSGKALGYRFNESLISINKTVEIEKPVIFKRIIKNINDQQKYDGEKYKVYKEHFLKTFKIDYYKALDYIDNWYTESLEELNTKYNDNLFTPSLCSRILTQTLGLTEENNKLIRKYNALKMSIDAIEDKQLFFRPCKTNGRIDTNLTNLKSELKQFIISDNTLTQLDICNSQPYILANILNSSLCSRILTQTLGLTEELKLYTKLTEEGKFYEYMIEKYYLAKGILLNRKDIKVMMFSVFYSQNTTCGKEKAFFKKLFPNIMEWINKQKENKHNELALRMQRVESEICIDIICDELNKQNIKYYTIHDAWLVDDKDVDRTKMIIEKCFNDKYNSIPTLATEKIN